MPRPWPRLSHESSLAALALVGGVPGVALAIYGIRYLPLGSRGQVLTGVLVCSWLLGCCWLLRERIARPLRTTASLLDAVREGDYTLQARSGTGGMTGSLGEMLTQVNAIAAILRSQRLERMEAATLLRKVIEELEAAIFALDATEIVRLVNPAGARLLTLPESEILGRSATELALAECLQGEARQIVSRTFPGGAGRWGISRTRFREQGLPHTLLVLSDLTRTLREEERQAWQRLVRVFAHEVNNSLTPISSLAGSLRTLVTRQPRPADWQADMQEGLGIVESRAASLGRFLQAYAALAKLPPPQMAPVSLPSLLRHMASLEWRVPVQLQLGPDLQVQADYDQLQQVLINLLRNAEEACLETGGSITVSWSQEGHHAVIRVQDEGLGLANTANLFVPFFTTKPQGSGIGLVLSRQIIEAHGGSLTLTNRPDRTGCQAEILLRDSSETLQSVT